LADAKLSELNMQRRECNCATIELANNRDMSGRATAEEINRSLRTGKGKERLGKSCLTYLASLTVAGLFVALAPMPTMAGEDERGGHKEIEALEAKVASLQATVSALQTQLAAVQSNPALALGPFVSVDPNPEIGMVGPHIIFKGANIHVISGSGATNDNGNPSGLGNLVIGYDEDPSGLGGGGVLGPGDRGGSHNLVIGRGNRFTKHALGGFVAGELNTIDDEATSIAGGFENTASALFSSVSGGQRNTANDFASSVSGGAFNTAIGVLSSVSGGELNTASGRESAVSGGRGNTASMDFGLAPPSN
jgi:hypothetical protein